MVKSKRKLQGLKAWAARRANNPVILKPVICQIDADSPPDNVIKASEIKIFVKTLKKPLPNKSYNHLPPNQRCRLLKYQANCVARRLGKEARQDNGKESQRKRKINSTDRKLFVFA